MGAAKCYLLLSAGVATFLTACVASPLRTQTIVPSSTPLSPVEVSTRPVLTSQPTITATQTPTGQAVEPLVTARSIGPDNWSPDGLWVAYWASESEEPSPGTMHFLNVNTHESCSLAPVLPPGSYDNSSFMEWQPDGKVFAINEGNVTVRPVCSEDFTRSTDRFPAAVRSIASVAPDRRIFLLATDQGYLFYEPETGVSYQLARNVGGFKTGYSWSPGKTYMAMTGLAEADNFDSAKTWVINVQTGQVAYELQWPSRSFEGSFSGPTWLGKDRFLIHTTKDRGPLLVTVGGQATQVTSELFNLSFPASCGPLPCKALATAYAAIDQETGHYHIVIPAFYHEVSGLPHAMLYHSENGQVEELSLQAQIPFSPDGRWLFLYREPTQQDPSYQFSLRPVDPPGNESRAITTQEYIFPVWWSPDSSKVVMASGNGIAVYAVPDGAFVGRWWAAGYQLSPGVWSPDSQYLLVSGYVLGGQGEGLFVVPIP